MKLISRTKNKLENEQRQLRKKEEEENKPWKNRWFKKTDVIKEQVQPDLNGKTFNKLVVLSKLAGLSVKNVPSGQLLGSKDHKKCNTALHWAFVKDNWLQENEVKV